MRLEACRDEKRRKKPKRLKKREKRDSTYFFAVLYVMLFCECLFYIFFLKAVLCMELSATYLSIEHFWIIYCGEHRYR